MGVPETGSNRSSGHVVSASYCNDETLLYAMVGYLVRVLLVIVLAVSLRHLHEA